MKKNNFHMLIALIILLGLSCKNANTNNEEIVKEFFIENDSIDKRVEIYSPDGDHLRRVFLVKDSSLHVIMSEYFENGVLSYEGSYLNGKRIGVHRFYDSISGKLQESAYYVLLKENDSLISRVNMIFKYDNKGDIIDSESVGCLDVDLKDTISFGDEFEFGFKVLSPDYIKAEFLICDFDSFFLRKSQAPCEFTTINNQLIALSTMNYRMGKNTIRGVITCYDKMGADSNKIIIYYEKNFYVR